MQNVNEIKQEVERSPEIWGEVEKYREQKLREEAEKIAKELEEKLQKEAAIRELVQDNPVVLMVEITEMDIELGPSFSTKNVRLKDLLERPCESAEALITTLSKDYQTSESCVTFEPEYSAERICEILRDYRQCFEKQYRMSQEMLGR